MNPIFYSFELEGIKGLAIYEYTDVIKDKLFLFKGCKDYVLKDVFINPFKSELSLLYKKYILIPPPSFLGRLNEKGFNHVISMFECLNLKIIDVFIKTKNIKQANLSYKERKKVSEIIEYKKDFNLSELNNKKICLIDDVCTTGSTLKACINLLKKANPKEIKILVMAKRILSKDEKELMSDSIEIIG